MLIRDIDDLTHVEWRYGMTKPGARALERLRHHGAQLRRRVGAVNRTAAVVRVHRMQPGPDRKTEQGERQAVAYEIEDDEAAAIAAHIADHIDAVGIAQVMGDADRNGNVGSRQRRAYGVGLHDGDGRQMGRRHAEVDADNLGVQFPADLNQQTAIATADIEYAADGQGVAPESGQDSGRIAKPAVSAGKIAMDLLHNIVRQIRIIHYFRRVGALEHG
jgi:hypothetical protein